MKRVKPRIKEVFEKTLKNGGNVSKAMREKKYSDTTIHNPINVTGTKSWEMLMDEYIPESLIAETHKEAFRANKLVTSPTEGDKQQPDWQTRMKATELGYKVRGKLTEKIDHTTLGKELPYNQFTDEQLNRVIEAKAKQVGAVESFGGEGKTD